MSRSFRNLIFLIPPLAILGLSACVSTEQWSATGGSRAAGVVRLSYEYPEFHQPEVSDAQALQLADNRCNSWGYSRAEEVPGQVRECSNMDDGNCDLWTVTREYQCKSDAALASTPHASSFVGTH